MPHGQIDKRRNSPSWRLRICQGRDRFVVDHRQGSIRVGETHRNIREHRSVSPTLPEAFHGIVRDEVERFWKGEDRAAEEADQSPAL